MGMAKKPGHQWHASTTLMFGTTQKLVMKLKLDYSTPFHWNYKRMVLAYLHSQIQQ